MCDSTAAPTAISNAEVRAPTLNFWHRAMPRKKAEASARAQEKVALQSEVMSNSRFKRMPLSKEAHAARKREARASFVATVGEALGRRSKRIAEASALALALEEEIAQSEIVLPEEREKQALQDNLMRANNNAERKRKARSEVAPG